MPITYATITGRLVTPDGDPIRATVTATPMTTAAALRFPAEDTMTWGPVKVATDELGEFTMQIPLDGIPLAHLWRFKASPSYVRTGVKPWTMGVFEITESEDLSDLVPIELLGVSATLESELAALLAEIEAAGPATDLFVANQITNAASLTRAALAARFAPLTRFHVGNYGAVGSNATLDTAALIAAKDAAVAAGGGVIDLRIPGNPNAILFLNTELEIPLKVDIAGDGGNFIGDSGSIIRMTTATARLKFLGRGGTSEGFSLDGNGTGHPDGLLWIPSASPVVVGRTFRQIAVINGAGHGWVVNSAQNTLWENCHGINNAGSNWVVDNGAGGIKFDRCGGSGHGEYGLLIQESPGGVDPYPTAPSHIQFDHCIWECQNTNVTGVAKIAAAGGIEFYSCGFAGNVTGTISSGVVVDVDGSAGALSVLFDSPLITGKNGGSYTLMRTEGLAEVIFTGHRYFYHGGTAQLSESNLSTYKDYGFATYSNVTTQWGEGTAGDLSSCFALHATPHAWQLPSIFTTAWSVKQATDAGIRSYVASDGALVFTGDGSGFTTKGRLAYSTTDDGTQIGAGPFRIAAGMARTYALQSGLSGAVTIDAKTVNHAILALTGNVTSVTVSNPKTGARLTVTVRQDATGGRTVAWGASFGFTSGAAPGVTTANTEYSVEFYYDATAAKWKELSRSTGVPI